MMLGLAFTHLPRDLFGVCITLWLLTDGDSRGLICYRFIVLLFFFIARDINFS